MAPSPKSLLPRSLFGRSLTILLVPLVLLQLVVGLIFFQRHYQRVTEQMTAGVAVGLAYAVRQAEAIPQPSAAAEAIADAGAPLGLEMRLDPDAAIVPGIERQFFDLTGATIAAALEEGLDRPMRLDLAADDRAARLSIQTSNGVLSTDVPRRRLSVSNPHQLLVLMLFASTVLATVAVLFLRNQVRPIRRLAEAAEAFGKGRSLPFRPAGAEEVRRAGSAFLSMRNRIERQIEQRTQMLSGVSHDLRTPLTRMKLTLALIDEDEETEALREDVDQMERMLGEFLDFARGDSTEETVAIDPFALARELTGQSQRGGNGIELVEVNETPDRPELYLRPMAVSRALQNLVSNAGRYGEHIRLTVRLASRSLSFCVEDDGPGIPEADRAAALQPFARLDAARNQDRGANVGLGLTIAMDVARSHGGTLTLSESAALGGLRAEMRLPR
jgi:two-component system, OmpR family, osmolarity sensor histidine kinase EnvZ